MLLASFPGPLEFSDFNPNRLNPDGPGNEASNAASYANLVV